MQMSGFISCWRQSNMQRFWRKEISTNQNIEQKLISGVGYIFIELNEADRAKLLTRMILRSKLFTRMMQASANGKVNMREFLYMLSDSTYVRRRSNVKKMMGYLITSKEYDFNVFIEKIDLQREYRRKNKFMEDCQNILMSCR